MEMELTTPERNQLEQAIEDCKHEQTLRYLTNCPICKAIVERLTQRDKNAHVNLWEYEDIKFSCGFKLELYNSICSLHEIPVRSRVEVAYFCSRGVLRWRKVLSRTEAVRHTMEFAAELELDQEFKDVILNTLEPLTSLANRDS